MHRPSPRRRPPLARREHHAGRTGAGSSPPASTRSRSWPGSTTSAKVAKLPPRILERLRHQAALQLGYRGDHVLRYELIPPSDDVPGQGLAALPEPSPLDVFFDIEADPWALDDGLEYLLGWVEIVGGEPVYHAIWAHDRAGEKAAFEAFVDLVARRATPGTHRCTFTTTAATSPGALKRLMQRHATREDEVDRLLRGRTLVNLYDHVVRSGIRASVESYSIKKIEKFYLPEREGGDHRRRLLGRGVRALDGDRRPGDPRRDRRLQPRRLRLDVGAARLARGPPDRGRAALPGRRRAAAGARRSGTDRRSRRVDAGRDPGSRGSAPRRRPGRPRRADDEQQGRWLLAALLDWHRREAKPQWWDYYRLIEAPIDDLVADASALGGLEFVEDLGPDQEVAPPPLSVRSVPGDEAARRRHTRSTRRPAKGAGEIVALDPLLGTVDLKRNPAQPHPLALIPGMPYGPEPMRGGLWRLADSVLARGLDGPGPTGPFAS